MNFSNYIDSSTAVTDALKLIELERSGKQVGYYTRYPKVNRSMMKYFRPGTVCIAGLSGSGKSTMLNNLISDFTNQALNAEAYKPIVVIVFCYEIPPAYEILRTVANDTQMSLGQMLSSEYDPEFDRYNRISDEEFQKISIAADRLRERKIYYYTSKGDLNQMSETVLLIKNKHPDSQLCIAVDHTLLIRKNGESSDGDLIQNTALFCHDSFSKYNSINFMIHQLNNDITKIDRIINIHQHYPKQSDLYFGSQLYWACDDVFVIHLPELLGISNYGYKQINTKGLAHVMKIKSRYSLVGDIFMKTSFRTGCFNELTTAQVKELSKTEKNP